jgi:ketosteroid isomerase-like protein
MTLTRGLIAPLAALTMLWAVAASPNESATASTSPTKDQLRARTADFSRAIVEASSKGWSPDSVARITDFYAIDTVVFPPRGEPLRGRQAQVTYWGSRDREFLKHSAIADRIDVSGDLATEWGTLTVTTKKGDAAPVEGKATYVSIWTRRDGVWRKQMDTWW